MDLRRFVGIPYAGTDCYALVRLVLAEHGVHLPAYDVPEGEPERIALFRDKLAQFAAFKPVTIPKPLDLIVFTAGELHIGLVVGRGRYLHASKVMGRSVISRWGDGFASTPSFYRYCP